MEISSSVTPSSRTWVLRFKLGKSTTLLHIDPLQQLSDVRAELLRALKQTTQDGLYQGQQLPNDPDDIIFGLFEDQNDAMSPIIEVESAEVTTTSNSKGKGKASAASASVLDCPKAVGMRPDGLVVVRFRSDGEGQKWNVHMPSIEETYGDDEMDAS